MFLTPEKGSALKLIDFGSGTFCSTNIGGKSKHKETNNTENKQNDNDNTNTTNKNNITNNDDEKEPILIKNAAGDELHLHTTFAGSAFYMSPEMFRKYYTVMTDVWSAGVTLYVLVAGYPADALQEAFDKLQSNKRSSYEDLKSLPYMPDNMPDSFFEMLFYCLTFKHRLRKSAGEISEICEFVRFHKELDVEMDDEDSTSEGAFVTSSIIDEKKGTSASKSFSELDNIETQKDNSSTISIPPPNRVLRRTRSMLIEGSVSRHTAMLKYGQYERSITSLLAAILSKDELKLLLDRIDEEIELGAGDFLSPDVNRDMMTQDKKTTNQQKLQIIKIGELQAILNDLNLNSSEM